jgi:hypothetical protein
VGKREIAPVRERRAQAGQAAGERVIRGVRQENGDQAFAMASKVLPVELASAFPRAALAQRQQTAELGVAGPVDRIDQHGQMIAQIEPAPDHEADASFLGAMMRPREACQRVAVGDRDRRQA